MGPKEWYARGHWRTETLWHTLEHIAAGPGAHATVSDDEATWSLPDLLDAARRFAGGLRRSGLRPGDAVVIQSRNSLDAFAAILGCFASGFVAIPLPGMFSAAQVTAVIANANARALLMLDEKASERLAELRGTVDMLSVIAVPDALGGGRYTPISRLPFVVADAIAPRDPDEDALVLYSSGSTGNPKGVVHSANTLRFAAEAVARFHAIGPRDTVLVALEFGFVGGTVLSALAAFLAGASAILMRQWDPAHALHLVAARRVTYTLLMPTHVYDVVNAPALDATDCRSLTRGILAGVPRHVREEAARRFCARPLPMYGMSESIGHVTFAPDDPWDAVASLDGRALPGTEIAIRDGEGRDVAPGEVGDLVLRGPNRLLRYLGNEDLTRASILDGGWFSTGDRASLDARGFMTFAGRAKEIIRRGGVTIVPADVETALLRHPAIAEVAVVPVPDARLGEKACACIVPRGGAAIDLTEITRHLGAEKLARYQWPEALLVFDALPRTPSLKVRRADLEAEARRRLAQGH